MNQWLSVCLSLSLLFAAIAAFPLSARGAQLTIACGSVGQEYELCKEAVGTWSKMTGHEVKIAHLPNSATERLVMFQRLLYEKHNTVDILQIDVVWPGLLHKNLLDLSEYDVEPEAFLPELIANNQVQGKLVALPWFADVGLLYYRKDLLEAHGLAVPETWRDLETAAQTIQQAQRQAGASEFWGYVWQGDAYEGLTCNVLEWITSHNGGQMVEPNGTVSINSGASHQAINRARNWVDTISPLDVLRYREEDARHSFQAGNALFMRNWPYAWSLMQQEDSPVRKKVGIAPLPAGEDGRRAGTLGGHSLAVSKYSPNPELAVELVKFLVSRSEQKRRLATGGYLPTRPELYDDPTTRQRFPHLTNIFASLRYGVARPSSVTGRAYKRISRRVYSRVALVLQGELDTRAALQDMEQYLQKHVR